MKENSAAPAKTPRKITKPGFKSLKVTLSDEHHAALEKTADGRPTNVWLSKLVERHFDTLNGKE